MFKKHGHFVNETESCDNIKKFQFDAVQSL